MSDNPEPQWCLVANVRKYIRKGVGGQEVMQGTKHFSGGTKLYCFPATWDLYEQIRVIGKHRGSPKLVIMIIDWRYLTNWRTKLIYEPRVLKLLRLGDEPAWGGDEQAKQQVDNYVAYLRGQETQLPHLDELTGMEPRLVKLGSDLPSLGGEAQLNYLSRLLTSEDRKVRSKVVNLIGKLKLENAAPMLITLLDDEPERYIQQDTVRVLEQLGTPEAAQAAATWRENQQSPR